MEGLQPHANVNLKKLMIVGYKGQRFPTWIEQMSVQDGPQDPWVPLHNLIEIIVYNCSKCVEIPRLDHLQNLKTLRLIGFDKVRFIRSSFNKLTSIKIIELQRLERILP